MSLATLRGALMMPLVMTWAFGVMAVFLALSFIPPIFRRCRGSIPRLWAKGIMLMCGIEWELRGVEHRRDLGPKIVLFNHVSTFDLVSTVRSPCRWSRSRTCFRSRPRAPSGKHATFPLHNGHGTINWDGPNYIRLCNLWFA